MKIFKIFKEKIVLFVFRIFSRIETYFGLGPGYFIGKFFGGETTGQPGRFSSIAFNFGDWQLHLHHWLTGLVILIFIFSFLSRKYKIPSALLFLGSGFLAGLIFQGIISYSDWYKILHKII